jgi:hypothetical protein
MGRGKRDRTGHREGDAVDWHGTRGCDDERWNLNYPEDDPLRDLKPYQEDILNAAGDEYVWPDMNNESEDDD